MFRTLLISSALILSAPATFAGQASEAFIGEAAREIETAGSTEIADTMLARIDTQRVSNFTLGKYARRFSAEERADFASAMERYLHGQLNAQVGVLDEAKVEVLGSTDRSETDSIVTTRITVPGEEAQTVRWRVLNVDGEWRVVDVEVYGLWLAVEQRAQVAAILDKPGAGISDVIASLDKPASQGGRSAR